MKDHQIDERLVFCENVLKSRKKEGLSCEVMAKRLGIGKSTLRSVERGVLLPRLSCGILFRVEREFGVSPKDMFLPHE